MGLRELGRMQSGLVRVSRIGCAAAFLLCGSAAIRAQLPVDTLGTGGAGNLGQQQQTTTCSPNDPTCTSSSGEIPGGFPQGSQLTGPTLNGLPSNYSNTLNQLQQQQTFNQFSRLPLDPPTEFQQMVASSIGKMLPIYGADLFRNPPSTFAPANIVPVTPDYVIGPGDELLIQAWGQITANGRFPVDRSGNIFVPQVGTVHVAGLHYDQLEPSLRAQISRVFRNFSLNVSMGQLRSIQVLLVGQARRPGTYTISSLSTLVNAIFVTGGPSPQGSLRHIQLKRDGRLVVDFDLYDLLVRGDKSNDVAILSGDVIYIPPVGPQVAVAGNVKVPSIYELKSAEGTVEDTLTMAGGLTSVASRDTVRLERVDERHTRSALNFALDAQGRANQVRDGDLLELTSVAGEFKDAITLRGNVANPGRYMWKQGMRIKDLIPDRDALVTKDYWLKRIQLGQPMLSYVPTCLPATPYGVPSLRYGIPVGEESDDPFWKYSTSLGYDAIKSYPVVNRNPQARSSNGDPASSVERSSLANIDPTEMATDGGLDCSDYPDVPLYVRRLSARGLQSGSQNQGNVDGESLLGRGLDPNARNQVSDASASLGPNSRGNALAGRFQPRNDVKLSEPDIDWSYAVVERQGKENLTTSLLPFNLGKLVLDGDASQNLELMPGDVVTIFSKADFRVPQSQQTRFVRLEGEFASSGVYSVHPGETLRQVVQRAGGLTQDAYLYGSEFTRESTRRVQQQRLNEYIDQISLQANTLASANASRAISPQDAASASAAQQQNQNIINSLKQARATGRIVLELPVDARNLDQLPDLPLEDGDRFIVPRVPSTVTVDGAVYNQNSFMYDPHRRVGDYIRSAGGANRDADKKRAYVIRAGGAVLSKQYSSSLRGNGFDSIHVYPGDTVVIPLNLDKGKAIRLIVDLAQIFGQFGIAIAAANTVLGQ